MKPYLSRFVALSTLALCLAGYADTRDKNRGANGNEHLFNEVIFALKGDDLVTLKELEVKYQEQLDAKEQELSNVLAGIDALKQVLPGIPGQYAGNPEMRAKATKMTEDRLDQLCFRRAQLERAVREARNPLLVVQAQIKVEEAVLGIHQTPQPAEEAEPAEVAEPVETVAVQEVTEPVVETIETPEPILETAVVETKPEPTASDRLKRHGDLLEAFRFPLEN